MESCVHQPPRYGLLISNPASGVDSDALLWLGVWIGTVSPIIVTPPYFKLQVENYARSID
ncbi:hypothetical protein [Sulfurovum sp. TSL1]|uniref:hypothetical protein n=1 Tax=Sulfurovum sp. TSL1 TaxID=2826994 RepID=UPI001CC36E9F|nr:hypothetical protein [Sulfurovum sp. TSL1]